MASNRPGGDWRNPAGATPPPARAASTNTSRRAWQPGGPEAKDATRKGRSRGFRLLLAGALTGALAALIVVVIWLFWPARYPQLMLVGATASDSLALPENTAGAFAAEQLAGWAGEGHDRDRPKLDANPAITVDASGAKIDIDPKPKNLVVYFTAHGGADANGAYLWMAPPDARSATAAHKVRVRDILDRVADARRGKATLLVFDACRVTVSWPHGMLFNDFARALKELDSRIDDIPGLAVICASDDDQRSWIFEERRTSVFGHYFLEALRGSGQDRGARVTAASAFTQTKAEVERWSIANRTERQTPILLPASTGPARAEKIDLAAAPAGGYANPASIESPANVPSDLEEAWKKANELAGQVPPPEANNPAKWREYLDLLIRYDRLFRMGANTTTVRDRAAALAAQLQSPSVGREPACLPTAVPTARALGRLSPFADKPAAESFRSQFRKKVWDAPTTAERPDAWAALLRAYPGQETLIRTAAADLVVTQLIEEGATPANLAIADAVLATTHGTAGLQAPAEAHFVRMLHQHLDKTTRPRPELLKQALGLRKEAEEAAWVFMADTREYPYSEVVYAWVRGQIELGDRERQRGQDLLFGTDSKMWDEAGKLFEKARIHYSRAHADGRKVAAALVARDKVFARLPYYARWLAAYRGTHDPGDIERLLDKAEAAARGAHHINEMTASSPPPVDQLEKLDAIRGETDGLFKAITDAFDREVAGLTNTPLPSNWHALDGALSVPFIPARRRAELLGFLRHVSYQLESNRQQPDGSKVPPPPTRDVAVRTGRMALALLGDTSADRRQLLDRPDREWWNAFRTVGDAIGERYRGLTKEVADEADKATRTPTLKEAGPHLAAAALRGRLADPAAPLPGFDPVAADQRFRRHEFLLWQAARTTKEGWADVGRTSPDGWYCRKVAPLLIGSAETLVRENASELTGRPVENMSPAELDRWLAECRGEEKRRPVELALVAEAAREVADEPTWDFAFTLKAADKDQGAVGYPVSWLSAPPKPYPQAQPAALERRIETDFVQDRPLATRRARFEAVGPPRDVAGSGRLTTTVLYRGHLYQQPTDVVLVGTPTREIVYTPHQGPAAFAIRANRSAVTGAVTILVDLTASMNIKIGRGDVDRLQEAKKGMKQILQDLLPGTTVTLASFYGDTARTRMTVEPLGRPVVMDGTNWERVYDQFKEIKATGGSTPLAGAIREVLRNDKATTAKFWPENFTGARTLIVLTDGEDNWTRLYDGSQQREAGAVALKALQDTPDDVNLHLIFFGLTSTESQEEEARAKKQFEILTQPVHFTDPPRTPAQLLTGIRDADALADACRRAMIPQFAYDNRNRLRGRLEATLPEETVLRATPALPRGVYDLSDARDQRSLVAAEFRPGDRVVFDARRRDNKFELTLPTYGLETAKKHFRPWATSGTAAGGGIHATIPELKFINGSNHADLSMAVTMEPLEEKRNPNRLDVSRPKIAWFDVAYADGKPADKILTPSIRIENRTPMWAPTWNLNVTRWEPAGTDPKVARHPAVTAYWLSGYPSPAESYKINLSDLDGSKAALEKKRTVRVRDSEVTWLDITTENYEGPGLPKGKYLTVRMKYGKPGELVYMVAGNFKGTDQPYLLHERHVYYDAQARYTVRFGPIFESDLNRHITLDLYSVADLKEVSAKESKSVTVRLPVGPLPTFTMPQDLEVQPRKE